MVDRPLTCRELLLMQERSFRVTSADQPFDWHCIRLHRLDATEDRLRVEEADDDQASGRFPSLLIRGGRLDGITQEVFLQTDPDVGHSMEFPIEFDIICAANPLELLRD